MTHASPEPDLLVSLGDGRRVNVVQVSARPELRPRLPYYMARNLSGQLHRGDHYGLVCPSIAVVWLAEPLFPELDQSTRSSSCAIGKRTFTTARS